MIGIRLLATQSMIAIQLPTAQPAFNHMLAALPEGQWQSWARQLVIVDLTHGQVVCDAAKAPFYVYFPTTAIVSLMYVTQDGDCAEFAAVGNDGVVGLDVFMGGRAAPCQAVVQSAGQAYQLRAQAMQDDINRAGPMLGILLRYVQTMIAQVAQTAVCNRHHSVDQLLCRRLLRGLDLSNSVEMTMTQESAANLLGVRRESVTNAANKLQREGLIRYHRGRISVLDRQGLEQRSCEYSAA
jgi:CRP-like cAMP-binding protein